MNVKLFRLVAGLLCLAEMLSQEVVHLPFGVEWFCEVDVTPRGVEEKVGVERRILVNLVNTQGV